MMLLKHKRMTLITIMLMLSSVILFYGLLYMKEQPGGFSDWRISRTMGLEGTIRIPLGKSPEDAIEQFRGPSTMRVIHHEPVRGGTLLFMDRDGKEDSSNLQIEYVRKTWFGWKWAWGGGYGMSKSPQSALNYMIMPRPDHISDTFPIVFGNILDPSVTSIAIQSKGGGHYNAELAAVGSGKRIWFAFLPSSTFTPFDIEAFDEQGELIAEQTVTDPNDGGSIDVRN
ncbi:hypothetical protein [Paenibacillus solani]|uniref:hypothetical protein n=1 Tax=Paenibacillus solani TaxID=1705565 RepID=UPI003D2E2FAE